MAMLIRVLGKNVIPASRGLYRSSCLYSSTSKLLPTLSAILPVSNTHKFISTTSCTTAEHAAAGGSNHSTLWTVEKLISASLVAMVPLAIAMPNPLFDNLMALSLTVHSHWGLEAMAVDYIRETIFGKAIAAIGVALVWILSCATLGGLIYFNFTDVGLGQAIRMIWTKL